MSEYNFGFYSEVCFDRQLYDFNISHKLQKYLNDLSYSG